jgi:hypothetical protein
MCIFLWIQSYWTWQEVMRSGYHNELYLSLHRGSFGAAFLRDDEWKIAGALWTRPYLKAGDSDPHLTKNRLWGFGYERNPGVTPSLWATIVEVPAWFVTALLAIPPWWLYRRQRRHRRIGFPVEVAANSTESNPS